MSANVKAKLKVHFELFSEKCRISTANRSADSTFHVDGPGCKRHSHCT